MSVFAVDGPTLPDVPILLDSPHSGAHYPADFAPLPGLERCRRAEDFRVDELFAAAPSLGIPLLRALFPRIVVDVNRARDDLLAQSVDGPLPFQAAPSAKARLGKGVIWMAAPPPPEAEALYPRPLAAATVLTRLSTYWDPYRDKLASLLTAIRDRHERVIFLDCHSMQSVSTLMHEEGPGVPRAEVVLSDRDGTSAAPELTRWVAHALAREGFEVALNTPYKGADLLRCHGRPDDGYHALQLELRRDLYMNEADLTLSERCADTAARLTRVLQALCEADELNEL